MNMVEKIHARRPCNHGPRTWCLVALLGLSVAGNVLQVLEIRSFQEPLRRCAALSRAGFDEGKLAVGTRAPSFKVHDLSGRPITLPIARPGKLGVAYVFTPQCVWCRRNLPNMKALMGAAGPKYDFLSVSLTDIGVQEFLSGAGLRGPAYVVPSFEAQKAYGLGGTPQTIVVRSDGVIVKNWKGAYTGRLLQEVSSTLDVQLPGLAEGR